LAIMDDREKEEAPLMMCVETILVVRRYFVLRLLEGCRPMGNVGSNSAGRRICVSS
jgi:hypothetical protein